MADINLTVSVTTLNMNKLKINNTTICYIQETHSGFKDKWVKS